MDTKIKIITLSENTGGYGFLGEWGLSLLIKVDGRQILLDTGLGVAAVHNADLLNINLYEIDTIVLSHGHVDHTGGLREILKRTGPKQIIAHPGIKSSKYITRKAGEYQYIGIPFSDDELESCGALFEFSTAPAAITEHVTTSGEIDMLTDYETIDENLFVKQDGFLKPDTVPDDLALIINCDYGLVVICGCAHRGVINTINQAIKITGNDKIHAVVGGIHLIRSDEERIDRTIFELQEMDVQHVCVSHCTGFAASARLAQEFGNRFTLNNAGTRLVFPA
jgi:7,8-dihydropterin-6-yl-methyl-4-(beta-D-ribofuranosyl)aminobenzene 5'-phosphate synthase